MHNIILVSGQLYTAFLVASQHFDEIKSILWSDNLKNIS